jgi:hypothetical protein
MAIGITNQDRKKAKNTTIILSVLLALFTLLTVVFGLLIPSPNEMKTVGADEQIKMLVEGEDGTDYFLLSDTAMHRRKAFGQPVNDPERLAGAIKNPERVYALALGEGLAL